MYSGPRNRLMSIYLDLFFNKNVCIPGTCTCTCKLVNLETFTNTQQKLHFTFETYSYRLCQFKIQLKFILSLLGFNQTVMIAIPDWDATGRTDGNSCDSWHWITALENSCFTLLGSNCIDSSWVPWRAHFGASWSSRGRGLNIGGERLGSRGCWGSPHPWLRRRRLSLRKKNMLW